MLWTRLKGVGGGEDLGLSLLENQVTIVLNAKNKAQKGKKNPKQKRKKRVMFKKSVLGQTRGSIDYVASEELYDPYNEVVEEARKSRKFGKKTGFEWRK